MFICVNPWRKILTLVFCAALPPVHAQSYPAKPIRFLVPFAPGGGTDIISRLLAQKMADTLGQPLVIDNRGGGGGTIAADIVAKSAPDGYTLMMNHMGMAFNAALYPKLPYDTLNDFAAIAMVGSTPSVLVVHPSVAAKSVKEFIALAKTKPKGINYGTAGTGSSTHLAVELFQRLAGIQLQHVPYKGAGPAVTDTIAGQIQMMIATMPAATAHIRANRLRALGVSGATRSPTFAELPTIAEAGVAGYDYSIWYGVLGPRALPANIVRHFAATTNHALGQNDLREKLTQQGIDIEILSSEKFTATLKNDVVRWGKIIRDTGIKAE